MKSSFHPRLCLKQFLPTPKLTKHTLSYYFNFNFLVLYQVQANEGLFLLLHHFNFIFWLLAIPLHFTPSFSVYFTDSLPCQYFTDISYILETVCCLCMGYVGIIFGPVSCAMPSYNCILLQCSQQLSQVNILCSFFVFLAYHSCCQNWFTCKQILHAKKYYITENKTAHPSN